MYCRNCGSDMDKLASICVKCGVKKGVGKSYCNNCGSPCDENAEYCTKCGVKFPKTINNYIEAGQGKSKVVAGVLGILLGSLGIHRFYLGYTGIGILQLILTPLTCGLASLWGFIEGILILCDTGITTDAEGNPLV